MGKRLNLLFDSDLIESICADFDLRKPNKEALRQLIFTLNGEYDAMTTQVLNLATGVGKTYLMAALVEYLRQQGIENVVIVTPGKIVQAKTVQNFTPGNTKYIEGAVVPPDVVTPQDYSGWIARQNGEQRITYGREIPILAFIFNIHQLIAPKDIEGSTQGKTQDAVRRKPRKFDENAGVLFDYLKKLEDLVVIADESHLYSSSAVAFNAALRELNPAVTVGLTATVLPEDYVIYKYPLYKAIKEEYVKSPVLAFRKGGYGADRISEEQQLRDALQLRELKQAYYDMYTKKNNLPHLNAIVFVVCADVDHATQVTELLRGPEYFGKELSVLQVDSKHEDEITERFVYDLDSPYSPTLAVVSVNKLKEGWDVKNIAVVVALRAMASEVLTQQTMGRGLRLPFGKYTKIRQIDQLDIISHQSFRELLEAENVLIQFGLEDAISEVNKNMIKYDIQSMVNGTLSNETNLECRKNQEFTMPVKDVRGDDYLFTQDEMNKAYLEIVEGQLKQNETLISEGVYSTVGVRELKDVGVDETKVSIDFNSLVIERNPDYRNVSYKFPVTDIEISQPPIDLSEITDRDIEDAAKRVTSTGDVLYRKEIVAALGKKLHTIDAESAEVDSAYISDEDVAETLVKLVINMQMIPKNEKTIGYIERFLVPKFMKEVTFNSWTVKSLESARSQLQMLIKDYIAQLQRSIREITRIHPREIMLDGRVYSIGTAIYDQIDSREQFVRGRLYTNWFKSLYLEESFDSYSGEYMLAKLMNISPHIVWWHRLHSYHEAYIYYTSRDRYFPDFVALDDKGIYWIIEGKDKKGRSNDQVQLKRKAAESVVRKLVAEKEYVNQIWGYLIAYEDDIEKADSWDDLKSLAQPVTNTI